MTASLSRLVNPRAGRVRAVRRLAGRVGRSRAGLFAVEGPQAVREAVRAAAAGTAAVTMLYSTDQAAQRYATELHEARVAGVPVVPVDDAVLAAMSETVTPQGLLAVCRLVDRPLSDVLDEVLTGVPVDVPGRRPALLAILAHVRDPGNAGTVLRAADAAGAGAVVLTEGSVDVHNPKCVRSTAGSIFHLPVVQGAPLGDVVQRLRERGVVVLAADGDGEHDLDDLQDEAHSDPGALLRRPTAWIFGNEAWGLGRSERALADAVVRVPLHGRAESLNLATAATVCLYASARAHRPAARAATARGQADSGYSPTMGTEVGDDGTAGTGRGDESGVW
ncbi:MAG TPA: RNA methyltransferase [Actinomycetales bacterium]|nr:RNA methyltransferase [Actinomycetales bacterium]